MALRSFKLRFAGRHVRVVPATDAAGCAFSGTGVDLFGADAARAFTLAAPFVGGAAELGQVRALSVDLERRRLLGTLQRGGVMRLDGDAVDRAMEAMPGLVEHLVAAAERALSRR